MLSDSYDTAARGNAKRDVQDTLSKAKLVLHATVPIAPAPTAPTPPATRTSACCNRCAFSATGLPLLLPLPLRPMLLLVLVLVLLRLVPSPNVRAALALAPRAVPGRKRFDAHRR